MQIYSIEFKTLSMLARHDHPVETNHRFVGCNIGYDDLFPHFGCTCRYVFVYSLHCLLDVLLQDCHYKGWGLFFPESSNIVHSKKVYNREGERTQSLNLYSEFKHHHHKNPLQIYNMRPYSEPVLLITSNKQDSVPRGKESRCLML